MSILLFDEVLANNQITIIHLMFGTFINIVYACIGNVVGNELKSVDFV